MDAQEELADPNSTVQSALLASILQAAQEQPCVSSTDGQDALCLPGFTCYVCNQPGNAERLVTCMSAPVYRRLTAGDNQQLISPAIASSDPLLQQLLQSGKAGTVARQIEGAKHCQRHFHQTCLDRRKEAVFDNRVTIAKKLKDDTQEVRVKDLRHRLCAECLQLEHGSLETQYTGVLDEETAALQAARRADKLSSKMKRSLQARADKLNSLGCKVALTHLSRKGKVSHINSASVTEALQKSSPEQQLAMQQELQKGPEHLIQLLKLLNEQPGSSKPALSAAEILERCADSSWHFVRRKKQRPEDNLLRMRS